MTARVLTVILNWRTPQMSLEAAAAALKAMEEIAGEIVLVDNDSQDGSFQAMDAHVAASGWSDRVRVLQSGFNGGFGAGNNAAIRAGLRDGSKPDFVYLLNSDAFPRPGAIRALLDYMQDRPRVGLSGSCLHGTDGVPHISTFRFPTIAGEFEGAARIGPITRMLGKWVVPMPVPGSSGPVDWLAGASMMIRQDVLDRIGLFDEGYFLYFEETDLCLRAVRAGIPTHFVRESEVMHLVAASTGMDSWDRVPEYWFDSRLRYFTANHGTVYAALATAANLSGGALHRLRCLVTGRRPGVPQGFSGHLLGHHLRRLFSPTRTRSRNRIPSAGA